MVLVEVLQNTLVIIVVAVASAFAGFAMHEVLHWLVGYAANGKPYFIDWRFRIPTAVEFDSPESMSNYQIRLLGGIVYIFPFGLLFFALFSSYAEIQNSFLMLGVLAFLLGGSGISETDNIAFRHPEAWKRLAQGKSIDLGDLGH